MTPQELYADDPILPMKEAAEYLGFRGKQPQRTLYRLKLERAPMPSGAGETQRFGIRRSVLNQYLASLNDPKSRTHKVMV